MSYSRRQLYALGEPLGDCVTRLKPGGRVYGGGGGDGGGGQPANTTNVQTADLPDWAKPYAKETLEKGRALSNTPYQAYTGDRIAGFSPLQEQAQKSAAGLDAGPEGFSKGISSYMSPYVEQALNPQIREATRASRMATQQQQAGAVGRGAFGGSRDALMRMENERNLGQQLGDIRGRGYQAAYDSAANQFRQGIGQQQNIIGMQNQLGGQEQALRQQGLTQAYSDFQNQQQHPYRQLGFMSDMIRGLPLGQQSTSRVYEAPPSMMGQLGGLGMGAYGLSKMFAADGGLMSSYAGGGEITSQGNKDAIVDDMYSIEGLQIAKEAALNRRDMDTVAAIDERIAQLNAIQAQSASINYGLGSAFDQIPQERQEEMMAGGGIVAFADGDMVSDPMGTGASEIYDAPVNPNSLSFLQRITNEPAWKAKATTEKPKTAASASAVDASNKTDAMRNASRAAQVKTNDKKVAPAPKQKKLSPALDKAVTKMAEEQGVPKDEFMKTFDEFRDKLQAESKEDLKGLQELIDKQSGKSKEIKEKALGKALAEFGFNMAAQASKTGRESKGQGLAGLLGSASAAAPTLAASFAESEKLAAAADDTNMKLQMEMRKFNIAARKNDSATAMQHATNMRQLQQTQETIRQRQAQLDETIRHNKITEGLTGARISASGNAYNTAVMRTKSNIAINAQKQAAKDWADPYKGMELKKQYPSQKSYAQSLYNDMWSQAMPQLELIGTKSAEE